MEIKRELVDAHRRQDWELARRLSQEKQRAIALKRNLIRRCRHCDVIISRGAKLCKMHALFLRTYAVSLLLISAMPVLGAGTVTLQWDASPEPGGVDGYAVLWGPAGALTNRVDAGTNLTATVTNLPTGLWYVVAVAHKDGLESEPSNMLRMFGLASSEIHGQVKRAKANKVLLR